MCTASRIHGRQNTPPCNVSLGKQRFRIRTVDMFQKEGERYIAKTTIRKASKRDQRRGGEISHHGVTAAGGVDGGDDAGRAFQRRNKRTNPATMPSWMRAPPLPLWTDRAKRLLVLESEVLKLSKALLCVHAGREYRIFGIFGRAGGVVRSELSKRRKRAGKDTRTVPSKREFCPLESS